MTARDFVYWLQGYFELQKPVEIGENETRLIQRHLSLVFKHEIDPSMGDEKHQEELNKIHSGIDLKPSYSGPKKDASGRTIYRC